ncbi:MAG: hypothetical protein LLG04_02435 [Parachlamydia sp.]|nr:hypothetical protein [Parachlamydia sp.]
MERSFFLQKKYFSRWRQFAARGCPLSSPPLEVLKKKIFLVHATNVIPTHGKLVAGCLHTLGLPKAEGVYQSPLRQTLHFSLNGLVRGHGFNCWEKKKCAVIIPLEAVCDRLLSVSPYDTSIAGDLALTPMMTLIVPEDVPRESWPVDVSTITYKSSVKLRTVIDRVIQAQKGWLFDTSPQVQSATGTARCALFDQQEINAPAFFQHLLKAYPALCFGSHQNSLIGEAWRIGELDMLINPLIQNYLLLSKSADLAKNMARQDLSTHDLQFLDCYISHQLQAIARYTSTIPPHFIKPIDTFMREVKVWQLILQIDLKLRQTAGKKLVSLDNPEVEEWIQKTSDRLRTFLEKGENIKAIHIAEYAEEARRCFDQLNLSGPSWENQYDCRTIASLCFQMPEAEFRFLLTHLEKRCDGMMFPLVRFHAYLYRWMFRGEEQGRTFLNRLFEELKQNPSEYRAFLAFLKQGRYDNPFRPYERTTVIKTARNYFQERLSDNECCDKGNHKMVVRFKAILQYLDILESSCS